MANIISQNQLSYWTRTTDQTEKEISNKMDDYFECLIECDDSTQSCKRICRSVLD